MLIYYSRGVLLSRIANTVDEILRDKPNVLVTVGLSCTKVAQTILRTEKTEPLTITPAS